MEKVADEYCDKIFATIIMGDEKIRFNELHRKLNRIGARMSKPTLIAHLNHLVENEMIQRDEEDKQRVSYGLNWKRFKELQKAKKINQTALDYIKNEKIFKSGSLGKQVDFTTAMLIIGELRYLKLIMLDILEPENKLRNYFSYTVIRKLYNLYAKWLSDSCKNSKENTQKIIRFIDKHIKTFEEALFKNARAQPT